ncbi:lipopolysaccharide biosynthesis protein [Chloroflexus sp.]|uniref:lipopolysaccharide biosynthesis protein n=1 Tax=Chloroflexus sp. TaxID=1904827 RepID=UPI00262C7BEA|nr:oligosaccharide flippase family protein [uncultured Chloroflexus sp.]
MISPKSHKWKVRLQQHASPVMVRLIRGVATVTAGAIFGRTLSAIAGILLVRYFNGPELYGQYVTLMTTLALMSNLLGLGFDTWLLREGGREPDQLALNARRLLIFKLIAASILITALLIAWQQTSLNWLLIAGMIGVIAESYIRTGHVILHTQNRNSTVAILQSFDALLAVVLILLLMIWPPQVAAIIVGQTVVSSIMLIVMAFLLAHYWQGPWRPLRFGNLIQSAGFFVLADVLANIYSQVHIALLAFFNNDTIVGTFRSAINLITISFLVPVAMFNVALPMLSRPKLERRQYYQLLILIFTIAFLYGLAVMIGLWWFGGSVLQFVYGHKYETTIPLLTPLSIVPLFKSLSFVAVAVLLAQGAQKLRVVIQSLVVASSLVGGIIIIPRLGIDGATTTYIVTEGMLCLLYWCGAIVSLRHR